MMPDLEDPDGHGPKCVYSVAMRAMVLVAGGEDMARARLDLGPLGKELFRRLGDPLAEILHERFVYDVPFNAEGFLPSHGHDVCFLLALVLNVAVGVWEAQKVTTRGHPLARLDHDLEVARRMHAYLAEFLRGKVPSVTVPGSEATRKSNTRLN